MPLPKHLGTKDQDPVYQFGHPYKQKRVSMGTQAGTRSEQGGGGGGVRLNKTTRMSEREMKRDQGASDVNQQLSIIIH